MTDHCQYPKLNVNTVSSILIFTIHLLDVQ
jgi:hypothetical protein